MMMKVLFVTQDDPFYVREFFDALADIDTSDVEIAAIAIAPPMNKKTVLDLARSMLDFYGPVDFVRMGLRYVGSKIGARLPAGVRGGRTFSVAQAAEKAGIPVRYVAELNAREFTDSIKAERIDVIVSVAAPQIFRRELIEAPAEGCINIHNATLPAYKGMLPNFWQMFDGRDSVGVTVHRINEKIDEGEILLQSETKIESGESLDSLIRRTKRSGTGYVLEVLRGLESGTLQPVVPADVTPSYFTFPKRDDVLEFRRRGYRLL
ncbi:MAG: formyltransferase family protein [Pseudomonadota bacterium]